MNLYTDSSLLFYRNGTDFWMFPLYSAAFISLIFFVAVIVETLGFLRVRLYHLETEVILFSSVIVWMNFIFLYCLLTLVRTFSVTVNVSAKSRKLCLVPNFRGKAFHLLSPLNMMYAVGFSCMSFINLGYFPSVSSLWIIFIMKGCCMLSNDSSAFIEMIVCFFPFHPLNVMCYLDRLHYVEIFLHFGNKSYLVIVYNPFNTLLHSIC